MKILIIRTTPNIMNLNSYNLQEFGLAKALIRKGHFCDVAYYCGKEKDHIQEIIFDGNKTLKVLWLTGFGLLYEGFFPTLHKYIENYDIIQVGGYVGVTSCYLNIKAKNKIVNYNGLYYCKDNLGDIKKAKIWDRTLLPLQNKKNMIVATKSVLATDYLKRKGISNVTTIGVGLDIENLEKTTSEKNEFVDKLKDKKEKYKYLLYIGVLEERRNILFLLEVFAHVLEKDDLYRLVLIGKGKSEYTKLVDNKIKNLGLEDKIIRCSKIEQKYMPEIYKMCDAFLLPTRYEIFGMVLLEAMYYGLPVFTTYNGGSSTIINTDNGVIICKFNANEWADKIIEVISNNVTVNSISFNAHKIIVEKFTWDVLADKFLEVYMNRLEKK